MTNFGFPYRIGQDGATADAGHEEHLRGMIEQVLFTRKGERVNRPDFGAGVSELLFSENAPELAAAAQHMVQSSLQQWMAGLIEVRSVTTRSEANVLAITIRYRPLLETAERSLTYQRSV